MLRLLFNQNMIISHCAVTHQLSNGYVVVRGLLGICFTALVTPMFFCSPQPDERTLSLRKGTQVSKMIKKYQGGSYNIRNFEPIVSLSAVMESIKWICLILQIYIGCSA